VVQLVKSWVCLWFVFFGVERSRGEKAKKFTGQRLKKYPRSKKKVGFFCATFCGARIYNPNTPSI